MAAQAGFGVLVLGGPTAGGKTELAIALAERCGAEIIGADSRQIYRGMPIGTAAPTAAQRARVPHHLIGCVDPCQRYSAARFVDDAAAAIAAIAERGSRAIVVGGTGFYLRALCGDVEFAPETDPALRARVVREARVHPVEVLHAWLQARDPLRAAAISARDPYRIGRALEIRLAADVGAAATVHRRLPTLRAQGIPYCKIALRTGPAEHATRIARRTDEMLAGGFVEEAERIGAEAIAADAVGYREALAYLQGWLNWTELRTLLARATRRYAKRQLTWFRAEPDLTWIDDGDLSAALDAAASIGWPVS